MHHAYVLLLSYMHNLALNARMHRGPHYSCNLASHAIPSRPMQSQLNSSSSPSSSSSGPGSISSKLPPLESSLASGDILSQDPSERARLLLERAVCPSLTCWRCPCMHNNAWTGVHFHSAAARAHTSQLQTWGIWLMCAWGVLMCAWGDLVDVCMG